MTRVTVLTASRAEFGLLRPVISRLSSVEQFDVEVVVTGSHLSAYAGATVNDVLASGVAVSERIPILLDGDTAADVSKSMGLAMIGFADYFERAKPDWLLVLGDRYETLAVCCAAANARIPIAHLYGGELTSGALDDAYRHAITKLSTLHFTSVEAYRQRVIQMGEDPHRVFTVGALGVENAMNTTLLDERSLRQELGLEDGRPFAVVTFHPVTQREGTAVEQVDELLGAFEQIPEMFYVFTGANADEGGREIDRRIDTWTRGHANGRVFRSLGTLRYLSALKYSQMVIGNSSSGLVEAPSFGIPTVNVGDRQKGRVRGPSVIDCLPTRAAILSAMRKAGMRKFREVSAGSINPYAGGNTSERVVRVMERICLPGMSTEKTFWDLPDTNFGME